MSVGYDRVAELINHRLDALLAHGHAAPLFVSGEWGTGKTHMLEYIRAACRRRWVTSAAVTINAHNAALNHPQRLFPTLAGTLEYGDNEHGLRDVLTAMLESAPRRARLRDFSRTPAAGDLGGPISELCGVWSQDVGLDAPNHPAFRILLGADIVWANYGYKREQALNRIQSLGQMMRAVGRGGLLLLLDEVETIDQLWNVHSRHNAYNVLGRLARMPGLCIVLSVTERFRQTVELDLHRGVSDLTVSGRQLLASYWEGKVDMIEPPSIGAAEARQLADIVNATYEGAYDVALEKATIERLVREWMANPSRNPRRLIRLIVSSLDQIQQ